MSEFRIRETGQVVSQSEIRHLYPNSSLPRVWDSVVFEDLGIDPVLISPEPVNNNPLKAVRRSGVEQDSKGNWVQKYEVVDMFADTIDDQGNVTTKAQHEEAFLAIRSATQWANVRQQRDQMLKDTDWVSIRAADTGVSMDSAWSTYRQALRDVTQQDDPFNIQWPERP